MQISNRVTGVQEDADSMLTQFEDSDDVVTSEYVICNRSLSLHQSYGRRLVVSRTSKDPFYCNGPSECQSGADEMCWQVVFCCCLFLLVFFIGGTRSMKLFVQVDNSLNWGEKLE